MTSDEWKIALEGRYYLKPFNPDEVKPEAPSADIAQLPPAPPAPSDTLAQPIVGVLDAKATKKKAEAVKRLANRIDINVRFGVYAGFPPHDDSIVCQWGDTEISQAQASNNERLWNEVTWELSVMHFRLEFLDLDRQMVPAFYQATDTRISAERQAQVCRIWNSGGIRVMWHTAERERDPFSSSDFADAHKLVRQMAEVMFQWPLDRVTKKMLEYPAGAFSAGPVFDAFRVTVFTIYAKSFYAANDRIPHIPLSQPGSLESQLTSMVGPFFGISNFADFLVIHQAVA